MKGQEGLGDKDHSRVRFGRTAGDTGVALREEALATPLMLEQNLKIFSMI
jgi:hypothetical protein